MSTLVLAIRYPPNDFTRLQLDQVNFDSKVDNFKCDVSTKTNIPKESMELVYCGNILDDELTLSSYGLKPGVMLHVLKKKAKDVPIRSQPMSEQDIKALVIAFKTLTLNPSHRNSLQKLSRPDILENIIMITPGLSQDPVAISLIQDPELMVRLANFETVRRIVELHPALAEAANHIAATVHEEAIHSHTAGPSTSAFGLLDLLSDDDDMESSQMLVRMVRRRLASRRRSSSGDVSYIDTLSSNEEGDEWESSQSSDSVQAGVSRQPSFSAITHAQLAAALASAAQNGGGGGSDGAGSRITAEMVSEAMERAMASVVGGATPSSPGTPTQEGRSDDLSNVGEQMRQMRELGLTDDAVNLQALQLAGGNLHAAVDLVFSGAITSHNSI